MADIGGTSASERTRSSERTHGSNDGGSDMSDTARAALSSQDNQHES